MEFEEYQKQLSADCYLSGLTPFKPWIPACSGMGLKVRITENLKKSFRIQLPGSKSFTNRALVLAGLCRTPLTLRGVLLSDDSFWGMDALSRLGFQIAFNNEVLYVKPPLENNAPPAADVYFGMAGTLARFFPAVILNLQKTFPRIPTRKVTASGTQRLSERPLQDLINSLRQLGADIQGESLPLVLAPSDLKGSCSISGAKSGQFLSGLLLAAAGAGTDITIQRTDNLVQPDYVRMTLSSLEAFGADIRVEGDLDTFHVKNCGGLKAANFDVEADASTACYFVTFAVLHNLELTITNLGGASLQPDVKFIDFLIRHGAVITVTPGSIQVHRTQEKVVFAGGTEEDFSLMSDQSLTAGIIGLFSKASVSIRKVAHIRHHESDRIAAFCENVRALGGKVEEFEDGFRVYPLTHHMPAQWKTFHDHRFAMTGFLAASLLPQLEILEPACVSKTAPLFFRTFEELGVLYE